MSEENYIDKMYKDAFKGYEIQPKKELDLKEHAQKGEQILQKKSLGKLIANNWLISLCVLGLGALVVFIVIATSEEEPDPSDTMILISAPDEESVVTVKEVITVTASEMDSINAINKGTIQAAAAEVKAPASEMKIGKISKKSDSVGVPKPVIIHKTIIQRDTVIEHKQIIKKVPSTHEE